MTRTIFGGPAVVVGEFVSADAILRGKYSFLPPDELVRHVLEEESPPIGEALAQSKTLVAGAGFGYGSGREAPARALKLVGIELLVGHSFGRMFYRNVINQGILAIECPALRDCPVTAGDDVVADLASGAIRWKGQSLPIGEIPRFISEMVQAGGLVAYCRAGGGTLPCQA